MRLCRRWKVVLMSQFSAGDTDSDSGKTKLEDYNLIYLNATGLNESSYQKILDIVSPQKSK